MGNGRVSPENAIYVPWIVWYASWVIAAAWANKTQKTPGSGRQLPYFLLEFSGFFCVLFYFQRNGHAPIDWRHPGFADLAGGRLWHLAPALEWTMVGMAAAAFLFCWWARIHLGRLWSGFVTRKKDHRIVDTGPYAIVRHPIYTGVIAAAIATAAVKATPLACLGVLVFIAAYLTKGGLEERFLREELGAEAYNAYRRRVPMLLPFA